MAIPGSGAISFNTLKSEFSGSSPISLSSYYRGGSRVPDCASTEYVPKSGNKISLSDFWTAAAPLWYGVIYPGIYNDGGSDVYGYSAGTVGSVNKMGGSLTLNWFFYYYANGQTYISLSGQDGQVLTVAKGNPRTDLFTFTHDQDNSSGVGKSGLGTWLPPGGTDLVTIWKA